MNTEQHTSQHSRHFCFCSLSPANIDSHERHTEQNLRNQRQCKEERQLTWTNRTRSSTGLAFVCRCSVPDSLLAVSVARNQLSLASLFSITER